MNEPSPPPGPGRGEDGLVVVQETGEGLYQLRVRADGHDFLVDEPEAVGGGDAGPTPYDLLSAALGACTAMTLRMYANRKSWPLARVTVEVDHGRGHAEDCVRCEDSDKSRVDIITRRITLEGSLDAAQRARLLEIADKCPVHRTLTGPIAIRTHEIAAAPAAGPP